MTKLRSYSHDARSEWFKFINHTPKIYMQGDSRRDTIRNGLEFLSLHETSQSNNDSNNEFRRLAHF